MKFCVFIWRSPSLSELTTMILNLDSEAPIYNFQLANIEIGSVPIAIYKVLVILPLAYGVRGLHIQ